MGTTLDHGIYLPDEGERNCYDGLAGNWVALDNHLGSTDIHVTINDKQAWNGHIADTDKHVTINDKQAWNGHIADTDKHVTASDKQTWNTVTSKANDSDVVHKSGNETIGGIKTFSSNLIIANTDTTANTPNLYLKSSKIEISSQGNTSGDQNLAFLDKNSKDYAYIKGAIQSNGSAVKIRSTAKDSSDNSVISELQILAYTNGNKAIFPSYSNEIDLGVSSYKWKSFNGVEPSSLSLPDIDNMIDISSYITDLTGVNNEYTPTVNGWICVRSGNATKISILDSATSIGNQSVSSTATYLTVMTPVVANRKVYLNVVCTSLSHAYFIPCLGNV